MNETDDKKIPDFMVILLKAAVLVLIVLCIFFIAYPRACVNLIEGRQTQDQPIQDINKPLIPANKDVIPAPQPQPATTQPAPQTLTTVTTTPQPVQQPAVTVTLPSAQTAGQQLQSQAASAAQTVQQTAQQTTTSALNAAVKEQEALQAKQDVYDYNVVKRYVAVEKEYLQTHPNDNAAATAITQQVMNEFTLNDQEWREIIAKANERGWFDALRGK